MKREIEAPDTDWLEVDQARDWLASRGFRLSGRLFEDLLDAGVVPGVRRLRHTVLIPWQGLVAALWRLELGDIPPGLLEDPGAKSPKGPHPGAKSPKGPHSEESG